MKSNSTSSPNLVSARSLQPFLNLIKIKTGDVSDFLKKTGHTLNYLSLPGSHITEEEWGEIINAAFDYLQDPLTAFYAVDVSPLWWPEALTYIFCTSENLMEGFQKVFEYRKLFHSSGDAEMEVTSQEVKLIVSKSSKSEEPPFVSDFITAAWLKAARQGLQDQKVKPVRVLLSYEKPKHGKKIEDYFEAPVEFSAKRSEIHFSLKDMQKALPERDAFLASLITQHIKSILKSQSSVSGFLNKVEKLVGENIHDPELSASKIAAKIPMSERSFYRKLSQEDLSFQKIHDKVRSSIAKKYLIETEILFADISFRLGFAEVSSFSRSFKRWTGESPSEYRHRHLKRVKGAQI